MEPEPRPARLADAREFSSQGEAFEATRSLQAEAGYEVALFGGRFIGTPNAGLALSDARASPTPRR